MNQNKNIRDRCKTTAVTKIGVVGAMALATSLAADASAAQPIALAYDFTVSELSDGVNNGSPPPVDSISGSVGFTFEPQSGPPIEYVVDPDFVDLSVLDVEYTADNTSIRIEDGDVNAITFGGDFLGPSTTQPDANDFWIVFFIDDSGDLFLPGVIGSFSLSVQGSTDRWTADAEDIAVTRRSLDPATLLGQLTRSIDGVGPGSSSSNLLIQAQAFLDANDAQATCGMLNAFLNRVRAQQGKKISAEAANNSISDGETIIELIGCD